MHKLCLQYNQTYEGDAQKRKEILDELLPNRGKDVYLQGPINFDFSKKYRAKLPDWLKIVGQVWCLKHTLKRHNGS